MFFNFVVERTDENILTTKISRITVYTVNAEILACRKFGDFV